MPTRGQIPTAGCRLYINRARRGGAGLDFVFSGATGEDQAIPGLLCRLSTYLRLDCGQKFVQLISEPKNMRSGDIVRRLGRHLTRSVVSAARGNGER
jgi:hypothetical protein